MVARQAIATVNDSQFSPSKIPHRLGHAANVALREICRSFSGVETSELLLQLSLHLPRFPEEKGEDAGCILREAERLAKRLWELRRDYLDRVPREADALGPLGNYACDWCPEDVARPILERFHYLLSHRPGSNHVGLFGRGADRWPVALASLSRFDLANLQASLPEGVSARDILVVSRVFGFDAAPPNSISYLLSKVRELLRHAEPQVSLLVTYLNPNVGFTGASYKADNWVLFGQEADTRYLYLDGDYKTDRFFWEQFGTSEFPELTSLLGERVTRSKVPLFPLQIFARSLARVGIQSSRAVFDHWKPPETRS